MEYLYQLSSNLGSTNQSCTIVRNSSLCSFEDFFLYFSSPIYYFFSDEFGTFIIGGSDLISSFRGYITQMDIYRRIALTYEQVFIDLLEFIFF